MGEADPPLSMRPQGAERDAHGRFMPGHGVRSPGNPSVRRLGEMQAAVRRAVTPEALEQVLARLIESATAGDVAAARLVLERALGRVPDGPPGEVLDMPSIADPSGALAAAARLLEATASGEVPAAVAHHLVPLIELARRCAETDELARRVAALEAARGGPSNGAG